MWCVACSVLLGHLAPNHCCARMVWSVCSVRCVPGPLASPHRCASSVRCVHCALSWPTWLPFTGVFAWCGVLLVRCPGPLCSCSLLCLLGASRCLCGVLDNLAPLHRCAGSVCRVACAVSWAPWLLFAVCSLSALCCVCGVLGHLAPVHRCPRPKCCVACAMSRATWLLFSRVSARCVVLCLRCYRPLGSCSPVCPLSALCCMCGVLCYLTPVHRCARSVRCVPCAVSRATWLLFTDLHTWRVVLRVQCPGPLGSCSLVCAHGVFWVSCVPCHGPLGYCSPVGLRSAICCVCGVLGGLAPVHRCALSVRFVACAVSSATWLPFPGVFARCGVLRVRCLGPPGSCSPLCAHGVFCVLRVQCAGPLGSCSPVCQLAALRCLCGVLGHLAPVHRCAPSVCCVACAVSWATSLLSNGVPAPCVALFVRCPGPLGSCSPVCPLCCLCVVLRVRCPAPHGSCAPVCPVGAVCCLLAYLLGALCCLCSALDPSAPVPRCARSVRCVACLVSWTTWLLFSGLRA